MRHSSLGFTVWIMLQISMWTIILLRIQDDAGNPYNRHHSLHQTTTDEVDGMA